MRARLPARAAAAVAALLLAAGPALAQGCALCRRNLEQNGGAGLLRGIYLCIVLLVSLPILMTGAFAFLFWRAGKRRRAEEAAAAEAPPAAEDPPRLG